MLNPQKILSLGPQKLEPRACDTLTRISGLDLNIPQFQRGNVVRLSLGRPLVNLLPVPQRTNAVTIRMKKRNHSRIKWLQTWKMLSIRPKVLTK